MSLILLLPLLTPLFTAASCLLLWNRLRSQQIVSVAGAVVSLASSAVLLFNVQSRGILVVQLGNWPAPYGITIVADLLSALMVSVTGIVGVAVLVYSLQAIDLKRQDFGFHPLVHVLLLGICGAFLTGDLFNMYVWFEVMLIASFVLVALGGERSQLEGAVKYVTLNLISSTFFLAAAGVIYGTVGTLNMADVSSQLASTNGSSVPHIAAAILLIAFGLKAAVFPLFFWLPASYHTPPAAVSAIMAGMLTKVGVYALVRTFSLLFAQDFSYVQPALIGIATLTMVTGVLGAAAQNELRRILSFHIVSQIGYMIMGLAIFTPLALTGMIFYLMHHIIVKTNLFLIAGIVQRHGGTEALQRLGGIYRKRLWLAMLFLISAFSLAGLPPFSGFWAKLALIRAGLEHECYALVFTALLVSLLTLFSMTKIWNEAFWRKTPASEQATLARSIPSTMIVPCVVLAGMTIFIGINAEPLFEIAQASASQLLDPNEYINAVLTESK